MVTFVNSIPDLGCDISFYATGSVALGTALLDSKRLNKNGVVNGTKTGKVIAVGTAQTSVLIGWDHPTIYGHARNGAILYGNMKYIDDQQKFTYSCYIPDIIGWEVNNIHYPSGPVITATQVQQETKISKDLDLSDWRSWTNKVPGECVCGMPKDTCDYHK